MSRVRVAYPILNRKQVVDRLRETCVDLARKLPISLVILFGSYASGRNTAGSDIDLLVVYRGDRMEDAYNLVVDSIRLPRLEPRIYTEEEFHLLLAGSPRFAEVLTKEGIAIMGRLRGAE